MCEGQRGEDCIDSSPGQSLPVGLTFITSYYFQAHGYGKYKKNPPLAHKYNSFSIA